MSDCPVWVLGDVTPEQIAAAKAAIGPDNQLTAISDEGTVTFCPVRRAAPRHVPPNWLKRALRGGA